LKGFTIAGKDGKFVSAEARIENHPVMVSSPEIKEPTAVRHAWADVPDCNLFNAEGLPAVPFRTDVP
jgi:sialate O-acetylesterase